MLKYLAKHTLKLYQTILEKKRGRAHAVKECKCAFEGKKNKLDFNQIERLSEKINSPYVKRLYRNR